VGGWGRCHPKERNVSPTLRSVIASVVAATALACFSPHHEVGPSVVHGGFTPTARIVSAGVVGCTVRYVLKRKTPVAPLSTRCRVSCTMCGSA
jgi:hypothetical protein